MSVKALVESVHQVEQDDRHHGSGAGGSQRSNAHPAHHGRIHDAHGAAQKVLQRDGKHDTEDLADICGSVLFSWNGIGGTHTFVLKNPSGLQNGRREIGFLGNRKAYSAALAASTILVKPAGSWMAISDSIFLLTSIPAFLRPFMSLL